MLRVLCAIPWTVWKGRHVVLCEEKKRRKCARTMARFIAPV